MKTGTLSNPNADFFTVFNGSESKSVSLNDVSIRYYVDGSWVIETGEWGKSATLEEAQEVFQVMLEELRKHDRT